MLTFLRKHQRIFFIFTTVIIVASFSFFGTLSPNMDAPKKQKETFLAKGIGGGTITKQQVERMAQFLSSSHFDLRDDRIQRANLLNDGVLEKEFLQTDLGMLVAEQYFSALQGDIQKVVDQAAFFCPYVHVKQPAISAESAWSQFAPLAHSLKEELKKHQGKVSTSTFGLLIQNYLQLKSMPSQFLRRVMLYQENQMGGGTEDPSLRVADLSLTGLHTAEEWFGKEFLQIAAQVILQVSSYAESVGLTVSNAEAKEAILYNLRQGIKMISREDSSIDLSQAFHYELRRQGLMEDLCLDMAKRIILFRKLFHQAEQGILVDPLVFQEFNSYAKEQAELECYTLPSNLKLKDFLSCLKLQTYLESVSTTKSHSLALPKEFLPISEIIKRAPPLVQRRCVLEVAMVDIKKEAQNVSLKQMWQWQTEDQNWAVLKRQFPGLQRSEAYSREEKAAILEGIGDELRSKIDHFTREQIALSNPQKIQESLKKATPIQKILGLSLKGNSLSLEGVQDDGPIVKMLEISALPGETGPQDGIQARDKLSFYSEDNKHYYSIRVLERSSSAHVLTFAEALENGVLDRMLEKKLEEAYPEARKKEAFLFLNEDGSWKPLSQVQEKVGMLVYKDLRKAIEEEVRLRTGKEPTETDKQSPAYYARQRLGYYMKEALSHLKLQPEDPSWIGESKDSGSLAYQWRLEKQHLFVPRSKKDFFPKEEDFSMPIGSWSNVRSQRDGSLYFYHMMGHQAVKEVEFAEVEKVKEPLVREAKKQIMRDLLHTMQVKQAIVL